MEKSFPKIADAVQRSTPGRTTPINLRPCPFCKGVSFQGLQSVQENGEPGNFTISCQVCGAEGPPGGTLEEAGKRWNLRL
jgi:hypothetical protein